MIEIFKDIVGYEGLYQVSNLGRVKSLNYLRTSKERILLPCTAGNSYLKVELCKDGKRKQRLIHRLVAEAFIPNPNKYPCINHKDECRTNNSIENLEWCSYSYNLTYGTRIKKVIEKTSIPISCIELNKVFPSSKEAYRQIGVPYSNINKCLKGIRKTAGGYHWTYA